MRDLHESGMSHELFLADWNAYYKVDLSSEHVCSCYLGCFSTCCWCQSTEIRVRKGGIVLKPVWGTWTRERLQTVWSIMTSGQVLTG